MTEWSPPNGCFVVRLDNQVIQPSIGWVWNPHTKTFGLKTESLPGIPIIGAKVKALPVKDPMALPHKDINWKLCDQGFQSPEIFRKNREVQEVYEDRMTLDAFQYVVPNNG